MPCHRPPAPVDDPRVYLAAERTFLAWVRTSVSLMGFGFVIARFALWTREYELLGRSAAVACPARSLDLARVWHGLCRRLRLPSWRLLRHRDYVRDLERGVANPPLHDQDSMILAGILALVGMAIAIHILLL